MSSFEELVRECDRLWLNCRCTRLRLTPVKKQVQKENRRKAVELKADWETFLQHAAENLEECRVENGNGQTCSCFASQ